MTRGRQIGQYLYESATGKVRPWAIRTIWLGSKRYAFCPLCGEKIEFPEGIEVAGKVNCRPCRIEIFYDRSRGLWFHPGKDDLLDASICPDCDKPSLPHPNPAMPNFHFCESCDIEFRWQATPRGNVCLIFPYRKGKMLMDKEELNQKYENPDPFGVKSNPADARRKQKIIDTLEEYCIEQMDSTNFARALDIGCGEGFITVDLPADEIVAYDISDVAVSRIPIGDRKIYMAASPDEIIGKFDLIVAAGVMVKEYDYQSMLDLIEEHIDREGGIVLICQNTKTEVPQVAELTGEEIHQEEFPYNEFKQRLRVIRFGKPTEWEEDEEEPEADDGLQIPCEDDIDPGEEGDFEATLPSF